MMEIKEKRARIRLSSDAVGVTVISLISGIINGLLGAGGGMILSLGLSALLGSKFSEKKDIYFNSQAAMIPTCIASYFLYASSGQTPSIPLWRMIFPAIIGGLVGGALSSYIESKYIRLIFAMILLFSGIRMILSAL